MGSVFLLALHFAQRSPNGFVGGGVRTGEVGGGAGGVMGAGDIRARRFIMA